MHLLMAACTPHRALVHFKGWHWEASRGVLMAVFERIKCPEQLLPNHFQDGKSTSLPAVYR